MLEGVRKDLRPETSFAYADIARWYDRLNRLMSLGRDRRWRRVAAQEALLHPGGRALDLGTGTGEMALALRRRWPESIVVAADLSPEMMQQGREKKGAENVRWALGDGYTLPFPDRCFDAVVSVFLLRNVADLSGALAEQRRVLRAPGPEMGIGGGRAVSLELVWPRGAVSRALFGMYFGRLMPALNGLVSGQPEAYRYLPRSVRRFCSPEELTAAMEQAGLANVRFRTMAWGTVALHVGERVA